MRRVLNLLVTVSLAAVCSGGVVLTYGGSAAPAASYGQIFVGDTHHDRIVRLGDLTGAGWTAFGDEGRGVKQFRLPRGIFVDRDGRIY